MILTYIYHYTNSIVSIAKSLIAVSIATAFLIAIGATRFEWGGKHQRKIVYTAFLGGTLASILFICLFKMQSAFAVWVSPMPDSPYVAIAKADAKEAGIDQDIFVRQINQESGFDPKAQSAAGAIGIAQFMPETADNLGIDPWNPEQSLKGAADYMASLLKTYHHDYARALAAYNAGPGSISQELTPDPDWLAQMPVETQNYVRSILQNG